MATDTQPMATTTFRPNPYVHSDYSQWERKRGGTLAYDKVLSHLSSLSLCTKQQYVSDARTSRSGPTVEAINVSQQQKSVSTEISKLNKPVTPAHIKLLKVQARNKKETLRRYKEHLLKLQNQNSLLMSTIQSCDSKTHHSVSQSLEKYHKFKGVLSILRHRGSSDIKEASCDVQNLKRTIDITLQRLRNNLDKIAKETRRYQAQLQTLLNYKEKDYPLKLVQAEQLRVQLEYLDELHQKEEIELEEMLQDERDKFEKKMEEARLQLEAHASEHWLSQMKRSVFARAVHNKIMAKEIELQEKTENSLQMILESLKNKIQKLKEEIKQNPALQSPLSKLGRCTPDADVSLDIQVSKDLPF